jgi:glycosyltransferase involved in cell wall biosynthesis
MAQSIPSVTIVTVVRNEAERLRRTLQSIVRHKSEKIEYVVVDGASTDGTLEVMGEYAGLIDLWVSEPDAGIYDAMNKGVGLCSGKYVMFLNAGDELLVDVGSLAESSADACVMIYGRANMLSPDGSLVHVMGKRLKSPRRFLKGMPLCHQAIIYRRDCLPQYDISFRIMSDRLLTYRLVLNFGLARTSFVDKVLVNYYKDGFSNTISSRVWQAEQNRFYRETGKRHYIAVKTINLLFKQYIKLPFKSFLKQ